MKKIVMLSTILLSLGMLSGCTDKNQSEKASKDDKLQIMTSFYPMYDFTKNIVGDEGNVELMVPAGTEAHDYEPSAKDLKKLQDADIFVYNNENMETWVPSMKETLEKGNVTAIKATENMVLLPGNEEESHDHSEENEEHAHEEEHSHELDPHVWLAPSLAMKEVEEIRDQLIAAFPDKKAVFTENAKNYLEKLGNLDDSFKETFADATQKSFVTQHSAFGYLALEYGLTQVPISGISPSEEPTAAKLAELKKFVEEHKIKYIYFEANATDAIAKTLADEAKVQLLVLNPLEGLTNEQLEKGEDYLSVMEDNLKSLAKTVNSESKMTVETTKEKAKTVHNGYFKDSDIKDRELSDWAGEWQSIYPYVLDGTFDQVFDYKAQINKDKTAEEYKDYYTKGYKTEIEAIKITEDAMTFTDKSGKNATSDYKYVGYKILEYKGGNRGVRYCFEALDPSSGAFKYVQFSDHAIASTKAKHYHLYFGNDSQEALVQELENWPTYFPSNLTGLEIAQDMLAH